ncbi:hypothetical protein FOZ63_009424, partial [Perkinsus olseni]
MTITRSSFVSALLLLTLASAQQAGLYTYINEQTSYIRTLIKEDKTMYLFYNCIGMETAPRLGPFPLRPGSAPGENTVDYESSGGVEKVHVALMENCPDFGLVDGDLLTIAEKPGSTSVFSSVGNRMVKFLRERGSRLVPYYYNSSGIEIDYRFKNGISVSIAVACGASSVSTFLYVQKGPFIVIGGKYVYYYIVEQSEPEYNNFKDRMQEVCGIALSPNDF